MPYDPFIKVLDNLNSVLIEVTPTSASPHLLIFNVMGLTVSPQMKRLLLRLEWKMSVQST